MATNLKPFVLTVLKSDSATGWSAPGVPGLKTRSWGTASFFRGSGEKPRSYLLQVVGKIQVLGVPGWGVLFAGWLSAEDITKPGTRQRGTLPLRPGFLLGSQPFPLAFKAAGVLTLSPPGSLPLITLTWKASSRQGVKSGGNLQHSAWTWEVPILDMKATKMYTYMLTKITCKKKC